MKRCLICFIFMIAVLCLAQDTQDMWNGFYVSYNYGKVQKTIATVKEFYLYYILDKNGTDYFFYRRSNSRDKGILYGGAVWGKAVITNKKISEYKFQTDFPYVYDVIKYGEKFEFNDENSYEPVSIPYEKLFPQVNE